MPGAQPPGRGRGPGHAEIEKNLGGHTSQPLLLSARWIVPVEPAGAVLEDHAVAVRDGRIEALLPAGEAASRFAHYERVELPEHVLIPGLVNARFVGEGAAFACAEMLCGAITCFNHASIFPEVALEAAREAGMRVSLGLVVTDRVSAYASDADDYLRKGLALRDRCSEEPLVSFCLAPDELSDAGVRHVATLAAELDLAVQAGSEIERLLGPGLTVVHAMQSEVELLARHGCSVVHCPSSELKLARGFAPIEALRRAGVNICLGTEAERLDLIAEMRIAALLAKAVARDPEAMPAHAALRAATLGGARALGLATQIGSIEPGKRADLAALPLQEPCKDPLSHIVYRTGREDVSHVWVDGALRVRDGRLENPARGLDTRARMWQTLDYPIRFRTAGEQ